jgi:flagellar motor switch/type III secretory pathway protein FliN
MEQFNGFLDVVFELEAVLGRRPITVQSLLDLKPGSLLATRKPAGEDVDLVLGGVRIGSGEMTVVGDTLAVQVTSLEEAR